METISMRSYESVLQVAQAEHPEWRHGQTAFNVLHTMEPDLANEIRGTELDPFYNDNLQPFFDWLWTKIPAG